MKKISALYILPAVIAILVICTGSCSNKNNQGDQFDFVFMTDIHLTDERNAVNGLKQALKTASELNPDFIITGGDLIMDALGQRYTLADSLYNLYIETMKELRIPLYNTLGNHEIYGIYSWSGADSLNPEYGEKMFETRIGKSYYTFDHKGWKFFILNSVEDTYRDSYIGFIDKAQIDWIKEELSKTDPRTPIIITTHIPFITAKTQIFQGTTIANDSSEVIYNGKEVLSLFSKYNLKLVLQGHLHMVEDIYLDGIHYVTGGAVSAGWWKGPNQGTEEGFMLVSARKNEVSCKYIDYGWEADKN